MIIGINPYLILDGTGQEAVTFYKNALEADVLALQTFGEMPESGESRIPVEAKDRVLHAHLKIGNSDLMISDTFPGPHSQPHQIGSQVTIAVTLNHAGKSKEIF